MAGLSGGGYEEDLGCSLMIDHGPSIPECLGSILSTGQQEKVVEEKEFLSLLSDICQAFNNVHLFNIRKFEPSIVAHIFNQEAEAGGTAGIA